VFGTVIGAGSKPNNSRGLSDYDIKSLKWLENNAGIDHIAVVRAAVWAQKSKRWHFNVAKLIDLYLHRLKLGLNPFDCQKETSVITENIVSTFIHEKEDEYRNNSLLQEWLTLLASRGLDIQSVGLGYERYSRYESFVQVVHPIQVEQLQSWSRFDVVRKGGSLEAIQESIVSGALSSACYDPNGLKLIHIAAAYDRVDVLEWLVETNPLQLDELDRSKRSVLDVATASNATSTSLWITRRLAEEHIHFFFASSIRRRRAIKEKQTRLRLLTAVQAWYRGNLVRRAHRSHLLSRLEESQRFQAAWGHVLSLAENGSVLEGEISWAAIKSRRFDLRDATDETGEGDEIGEGVGPSDDSKTSSKLATATSLAATVLHDESLEPEVNLDHDVIDHYREALPSLVRVNSQLGPEFDRILLTRAVLRWRHEADAKYLGIFTERIKQLASGDRSLLLKKSLTGCKTVIYEAKLDAGQRILYQESRRGLVVWYVAKHDEVSRFVRLIDKAESRSNRQLTTATALPEIEQELLSSSEALQAASSEEVLLDPQSDAPLRLYALSREDIHRLGESSNWQPPLSLTQQERKVVETAGTVLLLGRAGTGKTLCICSRIDYDLHRADGLDSFKVLFVARSKRICTVVEDVVGKCTSTTFLTFKRVLLDCETEMSATTPGADMTFLNSKKMDFSRFKRDVCHRGSPLDPLLLWTQIRSLIKGSIANLDRPRSREEYVGLGRNNVD
jgi:hypothetical protein